MVWILGNEENEEIGRWDFDDKAEEVEESSELANVAKASMGEEEEESPSSMFAIPKTPDDWDAFWREASLPLDIAKLGTNVVGGMLEFPLTGYKMAKGVLEDLPVEEIGDAFSEGGLNPFKTAEALADKVHWDRVIEEAYENPIYQPFEIKSGAGKVLERGVHATMEAPAWAARQVGYGMLKLGVPTYLVPIITTPLEFTLYALMFKGLKGVFPKGFDPAKISAKDLAEAERQIQANAVDVVAAEKVREAFKIESDRGKKQAEVDAKKAYGIDSRLSDGLAAERKFRTRAERRGKEDYSIPAEDKISPEILAEEKLRVDTEAVETKTPTGESPYVQKLNKGEEVKVKTPYDYEVTPEGVVFRKKDGSPYKTKAAASHLKKSLAKEGVETEAIEVEGGWALREVVERGGEEAVVERPAGELLPTETIRVTPEYYNDILGDLAKLGDEWQRGDKSIDMLEVIEETRRITNSIDPRAWEGTAEVPEVGASTLRAKGEALQGIMRKVWRQEVAERGDKSLVRWDKAKAESGVDSILEAEEILSRVKPKTAGEPLYADPQGKPFSSEFAAREWAATKGLEGDVIENPDGAGYLIRKSAAETVEPVKWYSGFVEKESEAINRALTLKDEGGALILPEELGVRLQEFKDWFKLHKMPDIHGAVYKSVFNMVEDQRIGRNLANLDSQIEYRRALKTLPDAKERNLIPHVIEQNEPMSVLSRAGQAFTERAIAIFEEFRVMLEEAGVKDEFIEKFYVNHVIRGLTRESSSFIRRRSRDKSGVPLTIREIQAKYPELVFETDIAKLLPMYIYYARRSIVNKRMADALLDLRTADGDPVLAPASEVPSLDWYVKLDLQDIKAWSRFGKGRKTANKARTELLNKLSQGRTYVHKDAAQLVRSIITEEIPEIYTKFGQVRAGVKRAIMYNPIIHGLNIESNVIMAAGWEYFAGKGYSLPERLLNTKRFTEADLNKIHRRMAKAGVELEGLYDISKRLGMDIYDPNLIHRLKMRDIIDDPNKVFLHPVKAFKDLNDFVLWDRWVKTGQVAVFEIMRNRFLKEGMSAEHAAKAAANMTNDLMGTLPMNWFTKNQKNVLRMLMFARNWNVSNFRTLTGALGAIPKVGPRLASGKYMPKPLRFEGLTDMQLRSMGKQYRNILIKGAIGIMATANVIQAMFLKARDEEFHPTWQNEEGHWWDIDTGSYYADGSRRYLKNWLFRQIDDYTKLASGHLDRHARAKAEPILRSLVEILMNVNYMNRPIREPGVNLFSPEGLLASGKYMLRAMTPLDVFVGSEEKIREFQDVFWHLTGTWTRRGMPARGTAAQGDFLKNMYEFNREVARENRKAKLKIDRLIQKGELKEAGKLAQEYMANGELSGQQVYNITRRLGEPFMYRVFTQNGELKKEASEFIKSLSEKDRVKYLNALNEFVAAKRGMEIVPRASSAPSPGKVLKESGGWILGEPD